MYQTHGQLASTPLFVMNDFLSLVEGNDFFKRNCPIGNKYFKGCGRLKLDGLLYLPGWV